MSDQDATREAERRGLTADKLFGWCNLRRELPGQLLARGQTWIETFARYDANNPATPETIPVAAETISPELQRACPKCHVGIGEKCKNYRKQNKQTCPDRLKPVETRKPPEETIVAVGETKPVQRTLFDGLE